MSPATDQATGGTSVSTCVFYKYRLCPSECAPGIEQGCINIVVSLIAVCEPHEVKHDLLSMY